MDVNFRDSSESGPTTAVIDRRYRTNSPRPAPRRRRSAPRRTSRASRAARAGRSMAPTTMSSGLMPSIGISLLRSTWTWRRARAGTRRSSSRCRSRADRSSPRGSACSRRDMACLRINLPRHERELRDEDQRPGQRTHTFSSACATDCASSRMPTMMTAMPLDRGQLDCSCRKSHEPSGTKICTPLVSAEGKTQRQEAQGVKPAAEAGDEGENAHPRPAIGRAPPRRASAEPK